MPGEESTSPSTSLSPDGKSALSPTTKKKVPQKKVVDSRASSERERRQQIRDRVLDLRDLLPGFQTYLGKIPHTRQIRLRDMNTVQTLNVTVQLLMLILQEVQSMGAISNRNPLATQLMLPSSIVGKGVKTTAGGKTGEKRPKKSSSESEIDRPYHVPKKSKAANLKDLSDRPSSSRGEKKGSILNRKELIMAEERKAFNQKLPSKTDSGSNSTRSGSDPSKS